jgi:hypothetical protein
MPVEEVETTETVEKTTKEQFTICDSCGLNDDTGETQIYTFVGQSLRGDLYFCEECLDGGNIDPMTSRISISSATATERPIAGPVIVFMNLAASFVSAYVVGGTIGILVGLTLCTILMGFTTVILHVTTCE